MRNYTWHVIWLSETVKCWRSLLPGKKGRKRLEKFTPFLTICRELAGRLGTWKDQMSCLGVQVQFPGTKDIIIWQSKKSEFYIAGL